MPVTPTYPGVYVEEIPSGVRTITGVATSITAFIGRARRGTVNEPVTVNSFGDFERAFGGLHEDYLMSYAVRDFYLNGGSQAIIVRLANPNFATEGDKQGATQARDAARTVAQATTGTDVTAAKKVANEANTTIQGNAASTDAEKAAAQKVSDAVDAAAVPGAKVDDLRKAANEAVPVLAGKAVLRLETETAGTFIVLEATSEGQWGDELAAHADRERLNDIGDRFKPLTKDDLFNLTIKDLSTGQTERFLSVTTKDPNSPRHLRRVLENESNLVRLVSAPATRPANTDDKIKPGLQAIVAKGNEAGATPEAKKAGNEAQAKINALGQPFSSGDDFRYTTVGEDHKGSDGGELTENDVTSGAGLQANKRGLFALDKTDLFNLLCLPPDTRGGNTPNGVYQAALSYCVARRAMLIVDPPARWGANKETAAATARDNLGNLGLSGTSARNAALFFPRVIESDPAREGQLDIFVPCGLVAGVMARTDVERGVWKAPAGIDAAINGIQGLEVNLNDAENGMLNPLGINCLRSFPIFGRVVWGARTLRGADQAADEYKYIPVRRTALFIEESLFRGLKWVVFEPNDEPLWAQIRLNVGAFMQNMFRQGAFQGKSPREAYFVKCDKETTTQNDINLGIVNVVVGFAPLKPAEFVIIKLQQIAGQIDV